MRENKEDDALFVGDILMDLITVVCCIGWCITLAIGILRSDLIPTFTR